MTEEKLWLLVSLQLSGEATPAELDELANLVQQDPLAAERVLLLRDIWNTRQGNAAVNTPLGFDKHLERLSNHLGTPALQFDDDDAEARLIPGNPPATTRKWWWIGGGIAASVLTVIMLLRTSEAKLSTVPPRMAGNTISTKPGSKSKIELPDGTQVWLNADSKLEYNGDFSGKLREVRLSGEAYFDVIKDKSRPFIIHTSTVQVKVLGTAFNVRSYPADKTTETALIRGSVEVTLNNQPGKKVVLKPNEKVVIDNATAAFENSGTADTKKTAAKEVMTVENVHLDKKGEDVYETMWVKNKLAFDETPFNNMMAEIERWYNVQIIVNNKNLSANTYTVTFENKTLDEVMEGLQFSAHFQYTLKDGVVTIW